MIIHGSRGEFLQPAATAIADLLGHVLGGTLQAHRGNVDQVRDLGAVHGVVGDVAIRVGDRTLEKSRGFVGGHAQFNGVAA